MHMEVDKKDPDFKKDRKEANRRANKVKTAFIKGLTPAVRKGITDGEKKHLRRLIAVELLRCDGWNATVADVP